MSKIPPEYQEWGSRAKAADFRERANAVLENFIAPVGSFWTPATSQPRNIKHQVEANMILNILCNPTPSPAFLMISEIVGQILSINHQAL